MVNSRLQLAFILSLLLHAGAIPVLSKLMSNSMTSAPVVVTIDFVPAPVEVEKAKPFAPAPPPPPPKAVTKPAPPAPATIEKKSVESEPAPPPREIVKAEEPLPQKAEAEKSVASNLTPGGGAENTPAIGTPGKGSGAGAFSSDGNIAMIPGSGLGRSGTGTGGGPQGPGTGPARSVGRPGMPIQTAKASYPPMALRMGVEADVPLKVYVDENGRVLRVEVTKTAGMGFDEEAVKTVRQYRFEPALADGRPVPTEFSYVYRFRLQK